MISPFEWHIENPSWAPVRNGVHPSEFVFQKSRAIASDFWGIQTHSGELCSLRVPMIYSISSIMFFSCDNFTKTSEITLKSSEIMIRGRKLQLSVEGNIFQQFTMLWYNIINCWQDCDKSTESLQSCKTALSHRNSLLQWNLYKATTKFCGLSRQVAFHIRENKHDFVKTVPGKWWNWCVFNVTSPSHYTGSTEAIKTEHVWSHHSNEIFQWFIIL